MYDLIKKKIKIYIWIGCQHFYYLWKSRFIFKVLGNWDGRSHCTNSPQTLFNHL